MEKGKEKKKEEKKRNKVGNISLDYLKVLPNVGEPRFYLRYSLTENVRRLTYTT